jgi:hypothetical protein
MKKVIVLAAVLLVALGAASFAQADVPDSQLLRTYQPVTHFDPQEAFGPTAVQSFIGDSALEQLVGGHWVVADAHPGPGALPESGTFRLNQTACSPSAPIGGLACYRASWDAWDGGSVVYGRVAHLADATVLQYWYFYYDDVYSYLYPPSDFIWQGHEGDWEVVNVVLSADGEPVETAYSQHCLGQRRAWSATPRWGATHPIVYVALGSHSNYFAPGTHQLNPACIPPPALSLLRQAGLPLPLDYAFSGGASAGPPQAADVVTTIHASDEHSQAWLRFPGAWGEQQWFHASFYGTVPLGDSPVGPAFQDVWQDPLATIASWPNG